MIQLIYSLQGKYQWKARQCIWPSWCPIPLLGIQITV
nr:MAG TPA: hypothetical protein [Caudoviricetes sp.]